MNKKVYGNIFNMAGPDIIESRQYYRIIADILKMSLTIEEIPITSYLAENPVHRPFMCHRIYDLNRLHAAGLAIPSTSIKDALRLHLEGLLANAGIIYF